MKLYTIILMTLIFIFTGCFNKPMKIDIKNKPYENYEDIEVKQIIETLIAESPEELFFDTLVNGNIHFYDTKLLGIETVEERLTYPTREGFVKILDFDAYYPISMKMMGSYFVYTQPPNTKPYYHIKNEQYLKALAGSNSLEISNSINGRVIYRFAGKIWKSKKRKIEKASPYNYPFDISINNDSLQQGDTLKLTISSRLSEYNETLDSYYIVNDKKMAENNQEYLYKKDFVFSDVVQQEGLKHITGEIYHKTKYGTNNIKENKIPFEYKYVVLPQKTNTSR